VVSAATPPVNVTNQQHAGGCASHAPPGRGQALESFRLATTAGFFADVNEIKDFVLIARKPTTKSHYRGRERRVRARGQQLGDVGKCKPRPLVGRVPLTQRSVTSVRLQLE